MNNLALPRSVLIVEDSVDLRMLLADVFEGEGYQVVIAANGKEALGILDYRTVDVIVTDLRMPVMDGVALGRTIKTDMRLRHIPIVLLTATPMTDTWATLEIFDAFLQKPSPLETLIETVAQALLRGPVNRSVSNL